MSQHVLLLRSAATQNSPRTNQKEQGLPIAEEPFVSIARTNYRIRTIFFESTKLPALIR